MAALCQKRTHAVQQKKPYSITSSARPSNESGGEAEGLDDFQVVEAWL